MTRTFFLSSLLAFVLLGSAPQTFAAAAPAVSLEDDAAYAAGTKAMNERRWSDAVVSFDQVINAKGKKADAALYWKAYALNKLDNQQLATETCVQLRTQFKDSSWNDDCRALSVRVRVDRVVAGRMIDPIVVPDIDFNFQDDGHGKANDPDADIKMLALNAVMRENPSQAVPLLRKILAGDQTASLKQHALFVLAQSKSPDAEALLNDLVLGKLGPELQAQAIQSSGIYRGKIANDSLVEAYRTTNDVKVKRAVISAFFISKDDVHLVELARQEKDLELKRRIVSQLSLMHGKAASDYMMELLK